MANFNLFLHIRGRPVFPAFVRLCFATNNYRRLSGLIAFVCFRLRPVNKYVREWARSPSSQQFAKIANISRYCSWLGTPLYRPSLLLLLILRLPTLVHSSGGRWHSVMWVLLCSQCLIHNCTFVTIIRVSKPCSFLCLFRRLVRCTVLLFFKIDCRIIRAKTSKWIQN